MADTDHLGHDRHSGLGRLLGTKIQPDRSVDPINLFCGMASLSQLFIASPWFDGSPRCIQRLGSRLPIRFRCGVRH